MRLPVSDAAGSWAPVGDPARNPRAGLLDQAGDGVPILRVSARDHERDRLSGQ